MALTAASAEAAFPGKNGRLVFRAGAGLNEIGIYAINPDGTALADLA